jgi:hypothetical protein
MTEHLVLLDDSIFDNGAYLEPGQSDVTAHLKRKCPSGWALDMRAVDGSVTDDIVGQLSSPITSAAPTRATQAGVSSPCQTP